MRTHDYAAAVTFIALAVFLAVTLTGLHSLAAHVAESLVVLP